MELFKIIAGIVAILIIILIAFLYFFQEKLMFFPQKLEQSYQFDFNQNFKELSIKTADDIVLNGLLFKADSAKGVIFYLHGNAGSLESWGTVAEFYTDLNYDVFIVDYRGFGKSEGSITGEEQLHKDMQIAYNKVKEIYKEEDIIVLGYSIGTGLAAKIASENSPKLLILQAPYYSFKEMMSSQYFFPSFILRYKFRTDIYLKQCHCPVVIFHGDKDRIIDYNSSLKLKEEFKDQIQLFILQGEGHNGITENQNYTNELRKILSH